MRDDAAEAVGGGAARQQDAQVAALAGTEEVWTADGWNERFGLDVPDGSMGFGDGLQDVARVRVNSPELLGGYLDDDAQHLGQAACVRRLLEEGGPVPAGRPGAVVAPSPDGGGPRGRAQAAGHSECTCNCIESPCYIAPK